MFEEELSIQDDKAYHDNRDEAAMSIIQSHNKIGCANTALCRTERTAV